MRFIHLYLVGYFILVVGAVLALWQAGVSRPRQRDLARDRRPDRPRPRHHARRHGRQADSHSRITRPGRAGWRASPPASRGVTSRSSDPFPTHRPRLSRPERAASRRDLWHELWFCSASHACSRHVASLSPRSGSRPPRARKTGTIKVRQPLLQGRQRRRRRPSERRAGDATELEDSLGPKTYFDRSRFDADLKRIQAFYADRGYPDARVTGFDVKLNDKQDEVDLTVTIAEGEPVLVAAIDFRGFDVIPADHLDEMKKQRAAQGRAAARSSARRHHPRAGGQRAARITAIPTARSRPTRTTADDRGRRR